MKDNDDLKVIFYEDEPNPKFVVMVSQYRGQWLFVRHKTRSTWEHPGGHVEPGENPLDAAKRELREETGAISARFWKISAYGVEHPEGLSGGILYFACIDELGDLSPDFEIGERMYLDSLANILSFPLTYPKIQPLLYARTQKWLDESLTSVYFIRHAQSDLSVHQDDIRPLTAEGKAAASRLGEELCQTGFDAIYSSPYQRAVDTVSPLAKKLALPVKTADDLREREIGGWKEDFTSYATKQWADFNYADGGESLNQVQARNIVALKRLLEDEKGRTVAIGTHGTALSTILRYYNPSYGYADFRRIQDVMPYVVRLDFVGDELVYLTEISEVLC